MTEILKLEHLEKSFGDHVVLRDINLSVSKGEVISVIGSSGSGKSTMLRCINLLEEPTGGRIIFEGNDISDKKNNVTSYRARVGMVFQRPTSFPKSIFENVAYGLRVNGEKSESVIASKVEESLKRAALWNEVKDRLNDSALALSGGQQQRLCIARALAVEPEILLMDEPTSALDPIATQQIEEGISQLRDQLTVIIVTHNMQQAARVSDYTAFFYMGDLIETDETDVIFTRPRLKQTEDYITGRFG